MGITFFLNGCDLVLLLYFMESIEEDPKFNIYMLKYKIPEEFLS